MLASIVEERGVAYPGGEDYFCPSVPYPECPFARVAARPNAVYDMVRRSLRQAGLDAQNFGTGKWNPLGEYIPPQSRVFVLCNFVRHRGPLESQRAFWSKCTHASVLRAVIDYVLLAAGRNARILFGNAPLQSCDWSGVLEQTGAARMMQFYAAENADVQARDLRLLVTERAFSGRELRVVHRDPGENAVAVTLAGSSTLSALAPNGPGEPVRFRVTDYDPRPTEASHLDGKHQYMIAREILESDVIVSVPKLKTHEKVGITCGLKGFVGSVASKDCLAHHRLGGSGEGGDEYPGSSRLRRWLSYYHDWTQMLPRGGARRALHLIADRNIRRALRRLGLIQAGAWHGNDTCWRMTLDLARILFFADRDGIMRAAGTRKHLAFIDGIVAGEGNGPLTPAPVDGGAVVFADDVVLGDLVAARLMGFDPGKIALVREALKSFRPAAGHDDLANARVINNGADLELCGVGPVLGRPFAAPDGWRGRIEQG